ncbi:Transcriptional regulator, GntR family [Marinobacterium lacunae]|uniref:Transcriptional regulator, GntR family n=1 Tax=Marinobacterium lacunae TaxID=1232683 RepID=A0A081G0U9_9GAMM|nr:FCD domain-containing protein [Marinobacterium lacunae]KEA64404.1 Transcriptional regulator, GntR family [Marinobacterium lacunae]MBR9882350.1 FadR family transcriptional regulator [Oceanospirillales bacterium]
MAGPSIKRRKQKLSDLIVDEVKAMIVSEKLLPGDRLPSEKELIETFGCSKGTVREALKALEVEGLVWTRPGPGGGAWLSEVGTDPASKALRNYLYFKHLSAEQVYQMRKLIEVELAVSVVGHLGEREFALLDEYIRACSHRPSNEEEQREQRIAELEFHNVLADACPNPLLGFIARFLNETLRDLVVLKKSYQIDAYEFTRSNVDYHVELVTAYRQSDEAGVRRLMGEHMCEAEEHFVALDGQISRKM